MPEERKLVSVLFADVVGSTSLGAENDPEVVRLTMSRYFARMKEIAEGHGGTVEKFIGDAVMVVFGVPVVHDDDAERAVRAAVAMRDAMAALNEEISLQLGARIAVNTGEAVTGTGTPGQFLVTGDTVNVAARLQQGADTGEVIVGALTEKLTRGAVEYASHASIVAKGKPEPIAVFTAVRMRSSVPEQVRGLPGMRAQLVGRERELRMLLETFDRVAAERRAYLFTIVGSPGLGKSRLVGEVLARVAAGGRAHIARGRALPYGVGITYWPLMEIVRQDAGVASTDERDAVIAKLEARIAALFPREEDRARVGARLIAMLGLETSASALLAGDAARLGAEIGWAMRRYLEALAHAKPTLVVVDDLQWAEPAIFELLDDVLERATNAPLLVVCIARPEVLEQHASWTSGRSNATTITLEPLSNADTATLISRLLDVDDLPDALRTRVVERSEGNPLFCEEFVRMLIDDGVIERVGERWRATARVQDVRVPESIQAVIAARIDRLPQDEKRALQIASVVGERFGSGQVQTLGGGDIPLAALRRKGLVVEDDDADALDSYRFRHLLVRDVAYAALPKLERADLHDRFAELLASEVGDRRAEFAQIIAYHAERALTLTVELRLGGAALRDRAARAIASSLDAASRVAGYRAANLIDRHLELARRAVAAAPDAVTDAERIGLAMREGELLEIRGAYPQAMAAFAAARDDAIGIGKLTLAAQAQVASLRVLVFADATWDQWREESARALQLANDSGDHLSAIDAGLHMLEARWSRGELSVMLEEGEKLLGAAAALHDSARIGLIASRLCGPALHGGHPAQLERFMRLANEQAALVGAPQPHWSVHAQTRRLLLGGQLGAAADATRALMSLAADTKDAQRWIGASRMLAEILLEQHDPEAAAVIDAALAESVRVGERWNRSELFGMRALAALQRGDLAVAEPAANHAVAMAFPGDVSAEAEAASALAQVRAAQGRHDEADRELRRAFELVNGTEFVTAFSEIAFARADFLIQQGRVQESTKLLDDIDRRNARSGYEQISARSRRLREVASART
jgi:predicted ATPase/class 3 adenylate cyclase